MFPAFSTEPVIAQVLQNFLLWKPSERHLRVSQRSLHLNTSFYYLTLSWPSVSHRGFLCLASSSVIWENDNTCFTKLLGRPSNGTVRDAVKNPKFQSAMKKKKCSPITEESIMRVRDPFASKL